MPDSIATDIWLIVSTAVTTWRNMVDRITDHASRFPRGNGLKERAHTFIFVSVVVFKLSHENGVSLLFSELWGQGCAEVAVWLREVAALKWAVRCCSSPAFQCLFTSALLCCSSLCWAPGATTGLSGFFCLVQRWEKISFVGKIKSKPRTSRTAGWWLKYMDFKENVAWRLQLCLDKITQCSFSEGKDVFILLFCTSAN